MHREGENRPFSRKIDEQVDRFCTNLAWFDGDALEGFCGYVGSMMSANPLIANEEGRIDAICTEVGKRIDHVRALTARRGA